jgi:hypothetical protein
MVNVVQYNDLRFIKIMSQRVNLCRYKKLPHELKIVLGESHKQFEDSAGQDDWNSEHEIAKREILLRMGEILISNIDVAEKRKEIISLQQLLETKS